jgi:hypothetical protein
LPLLPLALQKASRSHKRKAANILRLFLHFEAERGKIKKRGVEYEKNSENIDNGTRGRSSYQCRCCVVYSESQYRDIYDIRSRSFFDILGRVF